MLLAELSTHKTRQADNKNGYVLKHSLIYGIKPNLFETIIITSFKKMFLRFLFFFLL